MGSFYEPNALPLFQLTLIWSGITPYLDLFNLFFKQVIAKVNFKFYDVENWEINNYNKHIAQYLKK